MIRPLTKMDVPQVMILDSMSGNYVQQWLDDTDQETAENAYAWGCFLGTKLIGYCTIGGADDLPVAKDCKKYTYDSLLLSDVFVLPEYRHKGYGTNMVATAITKRTKQTHENVFLTLLHDDLHTFYEKAGFVWATEKHEYLMVKN